MFYDYAKIYVKGGDGGNGCVAFRREKYVPLGGPSGGDGGRGGDIIFVGDESLKTLIDFRYRQHYRADRGAHGQGKNMYGAGAEDLTVKVPVGTVIKDSETEELIGDIVKDGQAVIVAKGGRGGRGNVRFATLKDKAPQMAEKGEPGQEKTLVMELKLLADAGLIGFPNAGKSTIISRISAARPKIADYPFTTIVPNLGVVDLGDCQSFVVADLPGLISGAHTGAGLGHRFLRHIERTRVLIHVLDMSPYEDRNPWEDFRLINEELKLYKIGLSARPQLIVANKMDTEGAEERLEELKSKIGDSYEIFAVSAISGEGLQPLLWRVWQELEKEEPAVALDEEDKFRLTKVRQEIQWDIERADDGAWEVRSRDLEKLVAMTDMENEEAVFRMQRIMDKMGFDDALRNAGVEQGDDVRIGKEEFEFSE